jgi:hypothetical protein
VNPVPLAAWRHAPLGRKRPCFAVLFPTLSVAPAGRESRALAAAGLSSPFKPGDHGPVAPGVANGNAPSGLCCRQRPAVVNLVKVGRSW